MIFHIELSFFEKMLIFQKKNWATHETKLLEWGPTVDDAG
jgi:hypothetical protein